MLPTVVGASLLAACVTTAPIGRELVGKPLRVEFADRNVATVLLNSDATTTLNDGEQTFKGSWRVKGGNVCLDYPGMFFSDNDCFTYPAPLRRGVRTAFRTANGETVWVTMM